MRRIAAWVAAALMLLASGCYRIETDDGGSSMPAASESAARTDGGEVSAEFTAITDAPADPTRSQNSGPATTRPGSDPKTTAVKPGTSSAPTVTAAPDENDARRKALENKQGCRIYYGDGIPWDIQEFQVDIIGLNNEGYIRNTLQLLETELGKYPDGFIRGLAQELRIYLIAAFSEATLYGLAGRINSEYYEVYLTINPQSMYTLHHELMHIIDYHMEHGGADPYPRWSAYNPSGYRYVEEYYTNEWVRSSSLPLEQTYFISLYATTNEYEDRAELFAAVMTGDKAGGCFASGLPVRKKYEYMTAQMRRMMPSLPKTCHWDTPPV